MVLPSLDVVHDQGSRTITWLSEPVPTLINPVRPHLMAEPLRRSRDSPSPIACTGYKWPPSVRRAALFGDGQVLAWCLTITKTAKNTVVHAGGKVTARATSRCQLKIISCGERWASGLPRRSSVSGGTLLPAANAGSRSAPPICPGFRPSAPAGSGPWCSPPRPSAARCRRRGSWRRRRDPAWQQQPRRSAL